jgi:hypothetical protein
VAVELAPSERARLMEPAPDQVDEVLPLWFEWVLVVIAAGVVSCGLFGVILALGGWFHWQLALILGGFGTIAGCALARPSRVGRGRTSRGTHFAAASLCAFAIALAIWNGAHDGHHVVLDIDSGVNTVAGKWIDQHGDLVVHAGQPWAGKGPEFVWSSQSMFPAGAQDLEFQFVHFLPALMAEADGIGGDAGLFFVLPFLGSLGLLSVYAVCVRICRQPWLSLAATAALGLSIPQVWVSRDPYSETSTQVLLWSGVFLLAESWRTRRLGPAALGGLALGATFVTRIDALIYLLPLPFLAAAAWVAVPRSVDRTVRRWQLLAATVGIAVAVAIGAIDLLWRGTGYYRVLQGQVKSLVAAIVASAVVGAAVLAAARALPALRRSWTSLREHVAVAAGSLVAVILLLGWAVRPAFIHRTSLEHANPTIPAAQIGEGLPPDPLRTYAEQSMQWMSWYLGPITVGLAILGTALFTYRAIRRPEPFTVLALALAGTCSALYLWNPNITPTQVYVMRRYVPATLPMVVIAAAFGAAWLIERLPIRTMPAAARRVVPSVVALALVAFAVGMLIPVRSFRVQAGYNGLIDETCATLGPHAAVVLASPPASKPGAEDLPPLITQTLRSWCNVPVAEVAATIDPARLRQASRQFAGEGRTLWVITSTKEQLALVAPGSKPGLIRQVANSRQLQWTLTRPPRGYIKQTLMIYAAKVPA